jgi:hypothetical protein
MRYASGNREGNGVRHDVVLTIGIWVTAFGTIFLRVLVGVESKAGRRRVSPGTCYLSLAEAARPLDHELDSRWRHWRVLSRATLKAHSDEMTDGLL